MKAECLSRDSSLISLTRTYGFLQMPGAIYILDLYACPQGIATRSSHRYIGVDPKRPLNSRRAQVFKHGFGPQNRWCWHMHAWTATL